MITINEAPLISVIVPCYNQGKYLRECLDSVLFQTLSRWECIVVDDGSTDDTREIVHQYSTTDSRFKYHFQNNRGLSGARNTGLTIASGEYIHFLDSDDSISEETLATLLGHIAPHPEISMVFSGYIGSKEALNNPVKTVLPDYNFAKKPFFRVLCQGNILPIHAALMRRKIINRIGVFDENLKSCEDWDFWLRLGRVTNGVVCIQNPLVTYRMTLGSMTRNVEKFFLAGIEVLARTRCEDPRVNEPMAEFKNGCGDYYDITLVSWYGKAIGLFLAQKNVNASKHLISVLFQEHNVRLNPLQFLEIWKQILFGSILLKARAKAWREYKAPFTDFLNFSCTLYKDDRLAQLVKDRIVYYNSPFITRGALRVLKYILSIRKNK